MPEITKHPFLIVNFNFDILFNYRIHTHLLEF